MGKGEWKVAANGCGKFLLRWYYQNQIVDQKPIMTVGVNAATTLKTTKLDNYLKWSGGGMQVDPCVMEFGHKMLERAFQEDIPAGEKALGAEKRLCSWRTSMKASKCKTRQRTMVNFFFFTEWKTAWCTQLISAGNEGTQIWMSLKLMSWPPCLCGISKSGTQTSQNKIFGTMDRDPLN